MVAKRDRAVGIVIEGNAARAEAPPAAIAAAEAEVVRLRRGPWRAGDHSHGRARDAARWIEQLAPRTLPPGVERTVNDEQSKWYRLRLGSCPLRAILELEIWQNELWAHLSVTGRGAPPSAAEVSFCRDLFLGDRKAIQILPRKLERADACPRTVHLYAPLESDALPSFARPCDSSFLDY